jgi:predicted component of type VI protein secretion system
MALYDQSSNGTFVNGVKVHKRKWHTLWENARVTLGGPSGPAGTIIKEEDVGLYTFVVETAEHAPSHLSSATAVAIGAEREKAPARGAVGAARAIVLLQHPEVSRDHATMSYRAESKTWAIRDEGSLNGTFVDSKKIAKHVEIQIPVGSEIVIGGQKPQLATGSKLRVVAPQAFRFVLERE